MSKGCTVTRGPKISSVAVRQLSASTSDIAEFVTHTHIYYTGAQRDAREVLSDQNLAMRAKSNAGHARVSEALHRIKDLGHRILEAIETSNFDRWGQLLDEHWQSKKQLSEKISISRVDQIYDEVRARFNVLGGKIIGAGGGGFLMLYYPRHHSDLERFMSTHGMPRMHYTIEPEGTKVVAQMGNGAFSAGRPMAVQETA